MLLAILKTLLLLLLLLKKKQRKFDSYSLGISKRSYLSSRSCAPFFFILFFLKSNAFAYQIEERQKSEYYMHKK